MSIGEDSFVFDTIRQLTAKGPQALRPNLCETCGQPVLWVGEYGHRAIEHHVNPKSQKECVTSLKREEKIS